MDAFQVSNIAAPGNSQDFGVGQGNHTSPTSDGTFQDMGPNTFIPLDERTRDPCSASSYAYFGPKAYAQHTSQPAEKVDPISERPVLTASDIQNKKLKSPHFADPILSGVDHEDKTTQTETIPSRADSEAVNSVVNTGTEVGGWLSEGKDLPSRQVFHKIDASFVESLYEDVTLQGIYHSALENNLSLETFEILLRQSLKNLGRDLRDGGISVQERRLGDLINTPLCVWTAFAICNKVWGNGELFFDGFDTPRKSEKAALDGAIGEEFEFFFHSSQAFVSFKRDLEASVLLSTALEETRLSSSYFSHVYQLAISKISRYWTTRLSQIYRSGEPKLSDGKVRVRWKCACGDDLWDDFEELQEGAADAYSEMFHNGGRDVQSRPSESHSSSSQSGNISPPASTAPKNISVNKIAPAVVTQRKIRAYPLQNMPSMRTSSTPSLTPTSHLLLCSSDATSAAALLQPCTTGVTTDFEAFKIMRESHDTYRKGDLLLWKVWFSLKLLKVREISFVKFEYFQKSKTADIKHNIDEKDTIPPPSSKDYFYRPVPIDITPPVGSNHLVHFFNKPHKAEDEARIFDRLPKKATGLIKTSGETGWGLHLVDGVNHQRIASLAVLIGSLGNINQISAS
ncbi:hypothetical protein HYFRA_00001867 [Hymenoscyphus fraxineus]|uniref:Uncharacterized protein n=1 Tax=Hymenoscyphus fraxineus TaxID=746836 RepID=A0A9N9KKT0_9HELO|nr:hypothetical protein HYFRA_00001867 [Hymenoscyphus fraxineus]